MKRTRAALESALLSLLEEKPFDQLTIRDIAGRAEIGYATFFRHYETKEELLHDLAADQIRHLLELGMPALEVQDSLTAAQSLCRYVDEHRRLWTALLSGAPSIVREEFLRQTNKVAKTREPLVDWLPSELASVYGVSACLEILTWWLQRGRNVSVDEIARILSRLVVAPFVATVPAAKAKELRRRKA